MTMDSRYWFARKPAVWWWLLLSGWALMSLAQAQPLFDDSSPLERFTHDLIALQADFVQVEEDEELLSQTVRQGRLEVRKPGHLFWLYADAPQEWFFLQDKTLYHYEADLAQITQTQMNNGSDDLPLSWLLKPRQMHQTFDVYHLGKVKQLYHVRLTPKETKPYDRIDLGFDDQHQLRRIHIKAGLDRLVTIELSNVKKNQLGPEQAFQLQVPDGTQWLE